jgi:DNA-directed RNA polymerase subunit M/transcription elongation factor TFIIS
MQKTTSGFACSRCGYTIQTDIVDIENIERREERPIEVITASEAERTKVEETCPKCLNPEAFRYVSFFSGEHAGVRQERSLERFMCSKCGHTWTKA